MRVLVTRPLPAAERTAAELKKRGHQPVLLPLMRAEHRTDKLRPGPLPGASALAVTSAEALRALAELAPHERQPYLDLPLFAVGEATAAQARALGFGSIETGAGDGAALARHLLASPEIDSSQPILYLAGNPRSPDLEQTLKDASRRVEVIECYRMVTIEREAEEIAQALTPPPDRVLLYSSETARQFSTLAKAAGFPADPTKSLRFLCLSHKIAAALPEDFMAYAVWPMEPREDLLLDLV
ncbi:hypothetical protein ASE36_16420 [Rhizobium sp. Root274]|uniref:uroporphyrinogen-III synthase n=1 Tax=unclassified Rhizobium TaxID=2613769 RepID=UPI0007135D1D|nr:MULTISPECIES: uroporphyrinogen-III synthase [unclassified Rhizobium]KQW28035.1 hypothetical protein ASC71_16455 [Rhizobium sp. Root1240]KRD28319.1 hypothetical protein ASE36_16420 [Rhizobium sp. Root274]